MRHGAPAREYVDLFSLLPLLAFLNEMRFLFQQRWTPSVGCRVGYCMQLDPSRHHHAFLLHQHYTHAFFAAALTGDDDGDPSLAR